MGKVGTIVTIGATPYTLTFISESAGVSVYRLLAEDGEIVLQCRHSSSKGSATKLATARHNVFLERKIYATPTSFETVSKCNVTVEQSNGAINTTDPLGLLTWLTASSAANLAELLQGSTLFYLPSED